MHWEPRVYTCTYLKCYVCHNFLIGKGTYRCGVRTSWYLWGTYQMVHVYVTYMCTCTCISSRFWDNVIFVQYTWHVYVLKMLCHNFLIGKGTYVPVGTSEVRTRVRTCTTRVLVFQVVFEIMLYLFVQYTWHVYVRTYVRTYVRMYVRTWRISKTTWNTSTQVQRGHYGIVGTRVRTYTCTVHV